MDAKRRAQMAWAALLALLALLFIPGTSGGDSGSESPSSNPAPDESGQDDPWQDDQEQTDQTGQQDGAEDGSEDTSGDGAGDGGWYEDEETTGDSGSPSGTPDSGGHVPGPQPHDEPNGVDNSGLIDDILDEYPSVDAAPSWVTDLLEDNRGNVTEDDWNLDGGEDSGTSDETVYGDDSPASGYPGHYDGQDSENAASVDIPGFSRESALEGDVNLTWAGELAEDAVEWAGDNPEEALIISGAAALTGGAAYVGYSATTGTAMALSASEASSLAAVGVPMTAAANVPDDFREKLDAVADVGGGNEQDNSDSESSESGGQNGSQSESGSDGWDDIGTGDNGDETAPATPDTGGVTVPSEDEVSDPMGDDPSSDTDNDGGSPDYWDAPSTGTGDDEEDDEPVATPGSGGPTAGVFS